MTTLNRTSTCRFLPMCLYQNQAASTLIPDFWYDAHQNTALYDDTKYAQMRSWFLGLMDDIANDNLLLTASNGTTYTPSGISSDSQPPSR